MLQKQKGLAVSGDVFKEGMSLKLKGLILSGRARKKDGRKMKVLPRMSVKINKIKN